MTEIPLSDVGPSGRLARRGKKSQSLLRLRRAGAIAPGKRSLITDRRGAVAFETLLVYSVMVMSVLLPLADMAAAGFQFISGWAALRSFGQYVQYNPPPDVTSTSTWLSGLQPTVGNYAISNIQVLCGNTTAGAACTSGNVSTSPVKYFSYTTTVTLAPMVLPKSAICTSSNANPCSFTLSYSERFQ
jgi:hypothetical protein